MNPAAYDQWWRARVSSMLCNAEKIAVALLRRDDTTARSSHNTCTGRHAGQQHKQIAIYRKCCKQYLNAHCMRLACSAKRHLQGEQLLISLRCYPAGCATAALHHNDACLCSMMQIQKEETDYANHIQHNWQQQEQSSTNSQQQQQRLRLNTIGAAQLINPSLAAKPSGTAQLGSFSPPHTAADQHTATHAQARPGSSGKPSPAAAKVGSRAGSVVAAASASCKPTKAPAHTAVAAAAAASQVSAAARSSAGAPRSIVSRASIRLTAAAAAPRSAVGSRVCGSAVGAGAGSVAGSAVSYPCTPNFSEVGSSVAASEVGARHGQVCVLNWRGGGGEVAASRCSLL
jgi:hypothetical protein